MENTSCKKCNGTGKIKENFIPVNSGAMGHGLPIALGMALAAKRGNEAWKTYVLMSDGELDCGTTWECALLAGHQKLNNLAVIIDYNGFQAMGTKKEVLDVEPLADKWRAFNWQVLEIDGHNFEEINDAIGQAKAVFAKPSVIIAHTIPGKGVGMFERKYEWHGKPPNKEEGEEAIKALHTLWGRIQSEHE